MIDFEVCLFLLYGFFYYLWNLFVFVGKNIDWRLPSMKLVVSIMLYGTHSQSSHQSENERRSFSKKKIHRKMMYSSNVPKRWSFQKNCTGIWSFIYHEERWYFFFPKIWYFFYGLKMKEIFLKKYMEIWCFLYVGKDCISFSYKYEITFLSKKQGWSFPAKCTLRWYFRHYWKRWYSS